MKKLFKLFTLSFLLVGIASCGTTNSSNVVSDSNSQPSLEWVDYVALTKLDLNDTSKVYAEVTVKSYVDGDTTHFYPKGNPSNWIEDEFLKARYNSVDTPESTGKVEEWGKTAALFTKSKLESSTSIIIQSDTNTWNTDTTGDRYLVWVWYQPEANAEYRLLNLELIQEGYSKLKSAINYSLYETLSAANSQAVNFEKHIYGEEIDENFYYGMAQSVDMKELRLNTAAYENTKISVEGLVTYYDPFNHMAYAQAYDAEDQMWYGMNFYAGFTKFKPLVEGNYLRLVGTVSWYAPDSDHPEYGTWQVSGLLYLAMDPDYEGSMKILDKPDTPEYENFDSTLVTYSDLLNTKENEEDTVTIGERIESTMVKIEDLSVKSVYTTVSDNVNSDGALTLTCEDRDGNPVTVRTSVLKNGDGSLLVKEDVLNKTITARGVVTKYNGSIQIHVFELDDLQIA